MERKNQRGKEGGRHPIIATECEAAAASRTRSVD